jgi:hypothetical protein
MEIVLCCRRRRFQSNCNFQYSRAYLQCCSVFLPTRLRKMRRRREASCGSCKGSTPECFRGCAATSGCRGVFASAATKSHDLRRTRFRRLASISRTSSLTTIDEHVLVVKTSAHRYRPQHIAQVSSHLETSLAASQTCFNPGYGRLNAARSSPPCEHMRLLLLKRLYRPRLQHRMPSPSHLHKRRHSSRPDSR